MEHGSEVCGSFHFEMILVTGAPINNIRNYRIFHTPSIALLFTKNKVHTALIETKLYINTIMWMWPVYIAVSIVG